MLKFSHFDFHCECLVMVTFSILCCLFFPPYFFMVWKRCLLWRSLPPPVSWSACLRLLQGGEYKLAIIIFLFSFLKSPHYLCVNCTGPLKWGGHCWRSTPTSQRCGALTKYKKNKCLHSDQNVHWAWGPSGGMEWWCVSGGIMERGSVINRMFLVFVFFLSLLLF